LREVDPDGARFAIRWHPFLLRPGMPADGVPKAPDSPSNPRVGARMKSAGAAAGIDFTGRTDRYPNSLLAHGVLKYTLERHGAATQNTLMEVAFRHYFTDGKYPDEAHLREAVAEAGAGAIDADAALAYARDRAPDVRAEALSFSERGVSGVPYFFMDGRGLFSGARPPSDFAALFREKLAQQQRKPRGA